MLVTGGCGFIGSNFINWIGKTNSSKYKITNVDAMYYCANELNIDQSIRESNSYQFVKANLTDKNFIDWIIRSNQITHVIHFCCTVPCTKFF